MKASPDSLAETRRLRRALAPYARRSAPLAWTLFLATLAAYGTAVAGAVVLGPLPLRLVAAMLAGGAISSLFVIGHDAAHGAFSASLRVNGIVGRIAFLPALHNFNLWQRQHNRLHHRLANLKGFNSWSPLTKAEYDTLPRWRRAVERLYRGPLGFAPYYLVERWWRCKFFPRRGAAGHADAWRDFALLAAYLAAFVAFLAWRGGIASVLLGFVVPFLVWNTLMGATTYMQHTHPRAPWFETLAEWRRLGQEEVTIEVAVPRWYGLISHHIMEHPAHHVHPRLPFYRLPAAQRRLAALMGERALVQRFTPAYLLSTLARCKLYDFEHHRWLDFAGSPTSERTVPAQETAHAA
jgi:omega-6 fatty acid desaturase (delta-12 desaturase)